MVYPACQDSYQLPGATVGSLVKCIYGGSGARQGCIYKIFKMSSSSLSGAHFFHVRGTDRDETAQAFQAFQWRFKLVKTPKCIYCEAPTEAYKDKTVCTECYRVQEE